MPSETVINASHLMQKLKLTIAFAESASAGRLSAEFSLVPDCGKILKGGIVCYDACIKQDILGVPESLVEKYTPESAEVTSAMTQCLSKMIKADIYVSVTGLTMPGGSETEEKPVGTMFVHASIKGKPVNCRWVFKGPPEDIVLQTIDNTAKMLIDELSAN